MSDNPHLFLLIFVEKVLPLPSAGKLEIEYVWRSSWPFLG